MDQKKIEKVFEVWGQRYRDNPEDYWNAVDHLLRNTPSTYGEACAVYFISLYEELYGKD